MRRLVPTLLGAALVGLAAWCFLGPTTPGPERGPEARAIGRAGRETADAPSPLAAPHPERATGPSSVHGRASIVGVVRRDGEPVVARVDVVRLHDVPEFPTSSPVPTGWLVRCLSGSLPTPAPGGTTRSGEDGRFALERLAPGTWRVTAIGTDDARDTTTIDVPLDGAIVEVELALRAETGGLRGRVLTKDGRPFRGEFFVETVNPRNGSPWLREFDGPATPLDADGRFEATGLARGDVVLTALARHSFRATSGRVAIPHAQEFVWVVDAGFGLRIGRVVADESGAAVEGALVIGGGEVDGVTVLASATTDTTGAFSILVGGRVGGLRAIASGFTPLRKDLGDLSEGDEPIVLRLARGATITGRVTDAASGLPVADVRVRAMPEERQALEPEAGVTGADGRYAIEGLLAGTYVVLAEGDGRISQHVGETGIDGYNPFLVATKAGETVTLDVSVVRTSSVAGIVLDPSGAPIAGAVVASEPSERGGGYVAWNPLERLGERRGVSGPGGAFSIDGLAVDGTYVLKATARDGAECRSALVVVREGSATRVELRFAPERRIEVTVLDASNGAPIAGARAAVRIPSEDGYPDRSSAPSTTGPDGRAILLTRGPGALSAKATAEGYLDAHIPVPVPESGQVVVRLVRGFVLSGRAVRIDGSPAAGTAIAVHPGRPFSEDSRWEVLAGADGGFRFTFSSDTVTTVHATLGRGAFALEGEATGKPGGPPIVVTLRPRAKRREVVSPDMLIVRVVDADGRPVPSARAEARRESTSVEGEVIDGRVTFRCTQDPILSIRVTEAKAADGSPLPVAPARLGPISLDARDVEIRLPRERTIEGVVRGPDGRGVRGVVVRAWFTAEQEAGGGWQIGAQASSDGEGRFRLGQLGEQECELLSMPPPDRCQGGAVRARGSATDVVIRLRAAVSASITVLDEAGKPVAGVTVSATREDPASLNLPEESRTDAKGVARLTGLDPSAAYVLSVEPDRSRSDLAERTRSAWTPKDETVHLARRLRTRGVVRDPSGRPVADVNVIAATGDTILDESPTAADGTFELTDLSPGRVALYVSFGGIGLDSVATTVEAGDEHVVLTFDPGIELVVRIEDAPAGRRTGRRARMTPEGPPDLRTSMGVFASDGGLRFRGLKADRAYTLWIPPEGGAHSLLRRDVRVTPGELHVRLVAGKSITGRFIAADGLTSRRVVASMDGVGDVAGDVRADGGYEILGLPEGTWTVEASGRVGATRHAAEGTAAAGGTLDLTLRPK